MRDDIQVDSEIIDAARTAVLGAAINTEVIVWTTYQGRSTDSRRVVQPRPWLLVKVYANQALTLYWRHLAAASAYLDANYRNVPAEDDGSVTGTVLTASEQEVVPCRLYGDDYRLILKTGATVPTTFDLSLRLTDLV